MIRQTPGKLFLAEQRGLVETSQFRRYSTFSFGPYAHEHKGAFGNLYALNEETLAGRHWQEFAASQDSYLLLLPITGSVTYTAGSAHGRLDVGEVLALAVPAGTTVRLHNPYVEELISFLHLWVRTEAIPPDAPCGIVTVFEGTLENQLTELIGYGNNTGKQPLFPEPLPCALYLGQFAGRHEAVHAAAPGARFFAFVLAGAFELQGRLLHEKDGLALLDTAEVELEALSPDALVLLLELRAA